jgi:hypothetical protein
LAEVAMRAPPEAKGMARAGQRGLDVARRRVYVQDGLGLAALGQLVQAPLAFLRREDSVAAPIVPAFAEGIDTRPK